MGLNQVRLKDLCATDFIKEFTLKIAPTYLTYELTIIVFGQNVDIIKCKTDCLNSKNSYSIGFQNGFESKLKLEWFRKKIQMF